PVAPGPQAPPASGPQAPPAPGPQAPVQPDNVPETDPRAITEFRSTLDPYGTWVNDQKYGTVWVPNRDLVGANFAPYVSAGHWALTADNDWIWQSDYPFGGVVFHYGRWVWVPNTGWGWVAGRRYANAWVTWRVPTGNHGYIGWAPMAPAWGWYGGVAVSFGWYPPSAYVFCPTRYVFSYHVHTHVVRDPHAVHDVAAHTRNYTDGRPQHAAATPQVLPANSAPPRGPSLENARVPASVAPMARVPVRSASVVGTPAAPAVPYGADGSRRTFSNGSRPLPPSAYSAARPGATSSYRSPSYANPSMYARPRPAYTAPLTSGTRSAARFSGRTYALPSTQYAPPATRYSAPPPMHSPSFSGSTRSYSTPSFQSSPSFHSPAFHSPSFNPAPSFNSAPSRSFDGPPRR
ncbi:MAG TPA: DUF6600 domain-containing protein, partial [Polyangiaceae bacterium]|nr:DUF6600 domain-containing protein [Polyangiaceae bacterium]